MQGFYGAVPLTAMTPASHACINDETVHHDTDSVEYTSPTHSAKVNSSLPVDDMKIKVVEVMHQSNPNTAVVSNIPPPVISAASKNRNLHK